MLFALLTVVFSACSSDEPNGPNENNSIPEKVDFKEISLTDADAEVMAAEQNFAMHFFAGTAKDMISNNKKDNFAVSPLSATMCMSMLANSTSEDTQAAIIRMLGCENLDALNDYNKRLLEYLPVYNDIMKLSLVNNIWFANRYAGLSPDFVSNMNEIFKASISAVDFSKSSTLDMINKWSNDNTFGMIPTIAESLNPATKMMLANALYFKSNWHDKFNPSKTKPEVFNGVNGAVTADMMHIVENVGYVESNGIKMMNKQFAESHAEIYFTSSRGR